MIHISLKERQAKMLCTVRTCFSQIQASLVCARVIGACRPRHTRALPGLFQIMRTHIARTGRKDMWSPAYSICVHRCTYSVQCSDKIRFPQLRIKCGVAKSCRVPTQLCRCLWSDHWVQKVTQWQEVCYRDMWWCHLILHMLIHPHDVTPQQALRLILEKWNFAGTITSPSSVP